jgi:cytochrome c peroxidase
VDHSPHATDSDLGADTGLKADTRLAARSALAAAAAGLFALGFVVASAAWAHGSEAHVEAPAPARDGSLAVPAPGSYALPPLGPAADGAVLTSDGEPARLHGLFGEDATLLSFVYTQCSDAKGCPLATAVLHRVASSLAEEPEVASRLRLLSLSFDPERDTPEVMKRYGEGFQRAGLDWRFLTVESEAKLAPTLAAYRQTRVREVDSEGRETGSFAHLLRVFLIDRERRVRQVYSTELLDPELLIADVKTLLRVASPNEHRASAIPSSSSSTTTTRPGDDRTGYEGTAYTTQSISLGSRRGQPADLARRIEHPPLGLPAVPFPPSNPPSAEKIALGRRLFFDRRLSHNDTLSCAMCHVPEQGFTSNEMATAIGIEGRTVRRNAPTIYNTAYWGRLFHDGRETRLEHQIWGPLLARNEMGNPSIGSVLEKIARLDDYAQRFDETFPDRGITLETVGMAIASYERALVSGGSPFDRAIYGGEEAAMSVSALRGLELFRGKARCTTCHRVGASDALFTDGGFHNTGVGYRAAMGAGTDAQPESVATQRVQAAPGVYLDVPRSIVAQVSERPTNDLGLYEISRDPADRWKYRTPSLRNVALTAPYMHDGSLATLRDVILFYDRGGISNEGLDGRIGPLELSESEREDLVSFLESLTGSDVETLVGDAFAAPVGDIDGPAGL